MKLALSSSWIAGMFILTLPMIASAQDAPEQKDGDEEVVILSQFVVSSEGDKGYFARNTLSSNRTSERLVDIPQNIQIVSEDFLDDVNLDNGIDAFKYAVSGINKKEATSGDIMLRGFRVGNSSFLWNGLNFQGAFNIPLYDIERIEVIKGPAALLFGPASQSGGIVNYVSKGPNTKNRESYAKLSVGSFDLKRAEVSSTGPLGESGLSYRVTAAATDADHRRKWGKFEDKFVSIAMNYQVTPTSLLKLYYNYYALDNVSPVGVVDVNGELVEGMPDDYSEQEPWSEMPRDAHYGSAIFTTEITPTLSTSTYLNFSTNSFDYKQIFHTGVVDPATGLVTRRYRPFQQDSKRVNLQMDIVKTLTTGPIDHKITLGGTASGEKVVSKFAGIVIAPINVYNPVYNTPMPYLDLDVYTNNTSRHNRVKRRTETAYLNDAMTLWDGKLMLVGGVGFTHYYSQAVNAFTDALTASQNDQAYYKRFGGTYKPTNAVSLYASYTEDTRFSTRTFDPEHPRAGQAFDPSYTENKELGIKVETSDGKLFGSVVYFDMFRTNADRFYTTPSGLVARTQGDGETNKGFEADIGLSLESPLGPVQTILTYYDGDTRNFDGTVPDAVARRMWSAFVTQSCENGIKFGGGLYYRDKIRLSDGSGQLSPFVADDYITTTAFASYTRGRVKFSLSIDNLFDKEFVESGDNAAGLDESLGRTFKASVEYKF